MVNGTTAKECGQKLRRIRMARNMSQQELADILYTTPQNISKYEKEGINNIDTIMKINEMLECNLLKDEMDIEGVIGEIGKEILCVLVEHNGFVEVEFLIEHYMHGLSDVQITKEIVKLENIGLCIREQYVGLYNDKHDALFITAKGIISLKNNLNPGLVAELFYKKEDKLSEMRRIVPAEGLCVRPEKLSTYEQIVFAEGFETYQDVIDADKLRTLVCKLPISTSYKANFVWYLKKTYDDYEWYGKSKCSLADYMSNYNDFLAGKNAYVDILYRMITGLDSELLQRVLNGFEEPFLDQDLWYELYSVRDRLILKYSDKVAPMRKKQSVEVLAEQFFVNKSEWYGEYLKDKGIVVGDSLFTDKEYDSLDKTLFSEEDKAIAAEYEARNNECYEEFEAVEVSFESYLEEMAKKKDGLIATEWFTLEEIREFVSSDIRAAKTDDEKKIDELLDEICKKYPEVLEYFIFPDEWEESGLASMIKEFYGFWK